MVYFNKSLKLLPVNEFVVPIVTVGAPVSQYAVWQGSGMNFAKYTFFMYGMLFFLRDFVHASSSIIHHCSP